MKISELIEELESIQCEWNDDVEVVFYNKHTNESQNIESVDLQCCGGSKREVLLAN